MSCFGWGSVPREGDMDTTTLLIIIIVLLVLGGGWYGRGRWF
jgi:LPXTG-motif cell wall-anchored protein